LPQISWGMNLSECYTMSTPIDSGKHAKHSLYLYYPVSWVPWYHQLNGNSFQDQDVDNSYSNGDSINMHSFHQVLTLMVLKCLTITHLKELSIH